MEPMVSRKQGRRARYLGIRKNRFDVRRAAAVVNLQTTDRRRLSAASWKLCWDLNRSAL